MKVLILLALVVASSADAVLKNPAGWPENYFNKDDKGNYEFGYHDANLGPSFHSQSGDASGSKAGAYGVRDNNGIVRIVEYVADAGGYRANMRTSENFDQGRQRVTPTQAKPVVAWRPTAYRGSPYYYI